jgi:hypothetical protein
LAPGSLLSDATSSAADYQLKDQEIDKRSNVEKPQGSVYLFFGWFCEIRHIQREVDTGSSRTVHHRYLYNARDANGSTTYFISVINPESNDVEFHFRGSVL